MRTFQPTLVFQTNASECGAGKPGVKGFQKGNTCAKGDGTGSGDDSGSSNGGSKAAEESKIPTFKKKKFRGFSIFHKDLKEVKKLGGSTGAVLVEDSKGNRYVKKYGKNADHLVEEFRAEHMYRDMGVDIPLSTFITDDKGDHYKLSQFIEGVEFGKLKGAERKEAIKLLQKDFVADATLGNWDVIGLSGDNVLVNRDENGNMRVYRVDVGGSLAYRAQGTPKGDKWNDKNDELFTMRSALNPSANAVFGSMTDEEVLNQLKEKKDKLYSSIQEWEEVGADVDAKKRIDNGIKALENHLGLTSGGSLKTDDEGFIKLDLGESTTSSSKPPTTSVAELQKIAGQKTGSVFNKKLEYLNPHGLQGGSVFVPMIASSKNHPSNIAMLEKMKKGLPEGTKVMMVSLPNKLMNSGAVPKVMKAAGVTSMSQGLLDKENNHTQVKEGALKEVLAAAKTAEAKTVESATKAPPSDSVLDPKVAARIKNLRQLPPEWKTSTEEREKPTQHSDGTETGGRLILYSDIPPKTDDEIKALKIGFEKQLTSHELNAIGTWKSSARAIRQSIASGKLNETSVEFLKAINKAPKMEAIVYRGVSDRDGNTYATDLAKQLIAAGIGGYWSDSLPMCTSRNSDTGIDFSKGDVLMKINIKDGRYIGKTHSHTAEDEIVAERGNTYQIRRIVKDTEVNKTKYHKYKSKVKYYIELDQIA